MKHSWVIPADGLDLRATLDRIEGGYFRAALARTRVRGRISRARAAKLLGLTFYQFRRLHEKHRASKETR